MQPPVPTPRRPSCRRLAAELHPGPAYFRPHVFTERGDAFAVAVARVPVSLCHPGLDWRVRAVDLYEHRWPDALPSRTDPVCQVVWHDEDIVPPPGHQDLIWFDAARATALATGLFNCSVVLIGPGGVRIRTLEVQPEPGWPACLRCLSEREITLEDVRHLRDFGESGPLVLVVGPGVLVENVASLAHTLNATHLDWREVLTGFAEQWRQAFLAGLVAWPERPRLTLRVRYPRFHWGGIVTGSVTVPDAYLTFRHRLVLDGMPVPLTIEMDANDGARWQYEVPAANGAIRVDHCSAGGSLRLRSRVAVSWPRATLASLQIAIPSFPSIVCLILGSNPNQAMLERAVELIGQLRSCRALGHLWIERQAVSGMTTRTNYGETEMPSMTQLRGLLQQPHREGDVPGGLAELLSGVITCSEKRGPLLGIWLLVDATYVLAEGVLSRPAGRWAWMVAAARLARRPVALAANLFGQQLTLRPILEHLVLLGRQARMARALVPHGLKTGSAAEEVEGFLELMSNTAWAVQQRRAGVVVDLPPLTAE